MNEYKIIISFIPVFADNRYASVKPDFFKLLIDNKNVLQKEMTVFHSSIKDCLTQLYNEYLNIEYEWARKELVNCRKKDGAVEITYVCKMPYIDECNKKGNIININEFMSTITDNYYVEIITGTAPNCFK